MGTISNVPRPGYVWDSTDNVWYPIGVGGHSHSEIAKTIADAKGDLIVGTAADTVDRLAVGNNGETLVADSSQAVGLSYQANWAAGKNKLINGDFRINQRNFTSNTTTGSFNFDRWTQGNSGGSLTVTPQTFTAGAAPVAGYEGTNFVRLVTASQSAAGDYALLSQKIEDVRTYANQTVTVSFWAKASTGTPSVAASFYQQFGSGGSGAVLVTGNKVAITSSWARYSVTIAIPTISGKTIGAGSYLDTWLWTSAGSTFATPTNSLGIQNVTIDFWGVQVEAGSVATAFQTATGTIQGELAACQRYYYRTTATQVYSDFGSGYNKTATEGSFMIPFPVTMRITPTALEQSGTASNYNILHASGGAASRTACSSVPTYQVATPTMGRVDFICASGLTSGNGAIAGSNNNTTAYLGWSAEL